MIDAEESGFTAGVSTYIHLNPLRAGLEKKAGEYLWSSLPAYLGRAKEPAWLELERVYGSVEIDRRKRLAGREYGRYLNRVIRANANCNVREDGWELLLRGWCIGDDAFRERLLKCIGKKVSGARAETYGGGAKRAHDERYADKTIQAGMLALGLKSAELAGLRKGDKRKQVVAWFIKRRTSAGSEWISRQLNMGHRTAVSKAAKAVDDGRDEELIFCEKRWKIYQESRTDPLAPHLRQQAHQVRLAVLSILLPALQNGLLLHQGVEISFIFTDCTALYS